MQTLNIGIHTVIILVGPSQSGKSTWANIVANKIKSQDSELRVTVLSSDIIRRELLGHDFDRYDPKMLEASEAAFELLIQRLEAVTRFPINNEFVIIDTTGLDPDFRFKISDIARSNHYRVAVVLFDYATQSYFNDLDSKAKSIVSKHVETFKQRVLPGIKRKSYDYSFSVKDKEPAFFEDLSINIADHDIWRKSNFFEVSNKPLAIIGDVHESVEALKDLVAHLPEDSQIVFLGDLFDKGEATKAMLEYVETLVEQRKAVMVVGNHESFIARRLRHQIEALSNEYDLFSSLKTFHENEDLAKRFLVLFDKMLPYAIFKNYQKTICVTHAPCHNNAIGKHSERAQKIQRNFYFASREHDKMIEELRFIENEGKNSHPWHIFGHVAHAMKHMEMKNKVWLDSGAVYGRSLSAFIVFPNGQNKTISRPSKKLTEGKLLIWKKAGKSEVEVLEPSSNTVAVKTSTVTNPDASISELIKQYKLLPDDIYWLKSFADSGAKFIAGTMSPPRATDTQLEPIEEALLYFKNKKVPSVILQPKWMGSRMQIYLHKNGQEDFAITRSGAKAGHMDMLKPIMKQLHDKLDSLIDYKEQLVLDGELMPWASIGKELIEKEFLQYGKSIEQEVNLLSEDKTFSSFAINYDLEKEKSGIQTFLKQLELYGSEQDPSYKTFSILSVDGQLWTYKNQQEIYSMVSEEEYCVIDLSKDTCVQEARDFFNKLTAKEQMNPYEGIVMKPLIVQSHIAPYIKVRNENYLHLIYGHDYLSNYHQMCKNKRVGRKQALSIKQFEIGLKMLKAENKSQLVDLACQMKFEINQEQELDPRL